MSTTSQQGQKRQRSLSETVSDDSPDRRRKRPVACQQCHSRKIKCPGGQPCQNCKQAKTPHGCTYPLRDHKVTVSNKYLEDLRAENARLREQQAAFATEVHQQNTSLASNAPEPAAHQETQQPDAALNPLLPGDGRSWFVPLNTSGSLGHVGESADTAFVTRFRQVATGDATLTHFPRVQYMSDNKLAALADVPVPWPSLPRARLLVRTALDTIGSCYHCVRRSEVYSGLKQHYRNLPTFDTAFSCKLWVLFALGEVRTARTGATCDDEFPGISYYARASRIVRGLRERPQLEMIEVYLLLSIYSLLLNRRYTANYLASTAIRLAVIIGLNLDVPEYQIPDRVAREHRSRVFWTAYILDRLFGSKMGHPASIQDEDIFADLPSDEGLTEAEIADFVNADYLNAAVKLYAIIATRPILLHVFKEHKDLWKVSFSTAEMKETVGETPLALAEACIRCARHSLRILTDSWIDGSLAMFDYNYTAYLFSAASILGVSILSIGRNDEDDRDAFESACYFLQVLKSIGSFGATEYCRHIDMMRLASQTFLSGHGAENSTTDTELLARFSFGHHQQLPSSTVTPASGEQQMMTAEMALAEPSLQEFLAQSELNLGFLDTQMDDGRSASLYFPVSMDEAEWLPP
ncbi:hypothetical protein S40285_04506 [Stachybotrys chlorohalonatus IBT 40285]|uniref:Zn(2)-C6 fungal-type domain-containing protein n=1 Tax=Stachybotrys chlorohalonatus (strain IBT 40285) TaxID=1283841 RepID=A0A084QV16_STAC4|nr:hypothetical protein S40285_04506 [Stachybotrys chlorohalonata IBT 40285]